MADRPFSIADLLGDAVAPRRSFTVADLLRPQSPQSNPAAQRIGAILGTQDIDKPATVNPLMLAKALRQEQAYPRTTVQDAFGLPTTWDQWKDQLAANLEAKFPQVYDDPATARNKAYGLAMSAGPLSIARAPAKIISSQRFIDDETVARKIANRDFDVQLSPVFQIGGERFQVLQDGHHAFHAATKSGSRPNFRIQTPLENDRINLLKRGQIDDFLESSYMDSPWYYIDSGKPVW